MNRRSWLSWGLVCLAVLSFLAYWDEWKTKKELIEQQSKNRIFFPKVHQIKSLTFYHRDENLLLNPGYFTKIEPLSGGWEIKAPIESYADVRMINSLLRNLRRYQYEKILTDASLRLGDFGISSTTPDIELEYQEVSGNILKWKIFLGRDAPVGYMVYYCLNSLEKIYVGSKHLALMLRKSPFDLREKRMLMPWLHDLLELKISKQSGQSMELTWSTKSKIFKNQSGNVVAQGLIEELKSELEKISISEFFSSEKYQSMMQHFSAKMSWLDLELVSQSVQKSEFKIYLAGSELVGFNTSKKEAFKLPLSSLRYFDKSFDKMVQN